MTTSFLVPFTIIWFPTVWVDPYKRRFFNCFFLLFLLAVPFLVPLNCRWTYVMAIQQFTSRRPLHWKCSDAEALQQVSSHHRSLRSSNGVHHEWVQRQKDNQNKVRAVLIKQICYCPNSRKTRFSVMMQRWTRWIRISWHKHVYKEAFFE